MSFFLILCACARSEKISSKLNIEIISRAPEAVTNNAVAGASINNIDYIYSFGGLDSTKLFSGIHKRSYRYNITQNKWLRLPDLPDSLAKIASAANRIKDTIYILGGYCVFADGHEVSSNRVHRFNIKTNTFLQDGKPIPIPIDDQVQAVWRDSLIFVVTGWSQKENMPNVQIYNPTTNTWQVGNSLPNKHIFKTFGAQGVFIKDALFYFGGAAMGKNYPVQHRLIKGFINPKNPTEITWQNSLLDTSFSSYRLAATCVNNKAHFIGGSAITYNYNGVAYNKSGGVKPHNTDFYYSQNKIYKNFNSLLPMDLRGLASVNDSVKYIFGGMENNQKVSNKILKLTWKN
jgi:N-acetylneuraminic acid mutarotase